MSERKHPMEEVEAALDVADIARDLVALWESPNIQGLPRAERNAAIEGTREKLIAAVKEWDIWVVSQFEISLAQILWSGGK